MYGLAVNLIVSVSGHPWIINEIMFQTCRPWQPRHPQILADKLTISQHQGGQIMPNKLLATPDFQTFRRPCVCT